MILLATGCSDDDDNEAPANVLVGTWTLTNETASGCNDPTDNYNESVSCDATDCLKVRFTADGKVVAVGVDAGTPYEENNGTYTVKSNNKVDLCDLGDCESWAYSISGNVLTLSFSDPVDGCNSVIRFTRN